MLPLQVLGIVAFLAAAGAAWTVSNRISQVEVDLRQEISAVRRRMANFEGATTATLRQQSAQLQQLLLALEKR